MRFDSKNVFYRLIGILFTLPVFLSLFCMNVQAQGTAFSDWSNKLANEVGGAGGYSLEAFEAAKGHDYYLFSARSLWTDLGYQNGKQLAGSAPIICSLTVLHTFLAEYYEGPAKDWPWHLAQAPIFTGTEALDETGEPSVRWVSSWTDNRGYWRYHQDARKINAKLYADLIVEWVEKYPVEGIFLDYFDEKPWTYPEDPALPFENVGSYLWPHYQIQLVYHLRQALGPEFLLIANGKWAMQQGGLVQPMLLSGVNWERCGTLWWDVPTFLDLADKGSHGLQFFDGRPGNARRIGAWDLPQAAQQAAIQLGGFFVVGKGFPELK